MTCAILAKPSVAEFGGRQGETQILTLRGSIVGETITLKKAERLVELHTGRRPPIAVTESALMDKIARV
jgi:hypothetical protein